MAGESRGFNPLQPPQLAAQVKAAQAAIEANKPRNLTATKDADGNVVLTLDDGTTATLPTAG